MLTERTEDYLEAILNIYLNKGYVRVKDIASSLKVKYPTVTEMMKKLQSMRLVTYEKYGGILLTESGAEIARVIKDRHDVLYKLLTISGVPSQVAEHDACVIEHRLSPKSLEHLKKLVIALESEHASRFIKDNM